MEALAHFFTALASAIAAFIPLHSVAYVAAATFPSEEARVIFAGDMMFDRSVRTAIDKKGGDFIFSCIDSTLRESDLVVANLEGPITGNLSMSQGSAIGSHDNFVFTFPTSVADLLRAHGIAVVNLGNNHIFNFGAAGVRSTIQSLEQAKVLYFGDPLSQSAASATVHGIRLAFINYNEFERSSDASTTVRQIETAKTLGQIPIVYTHWGIEYATSSVPYQKDLAHRFVDAGAAIVIGSHPHVVQDREWYRGVNIYYSLGNFIFDQYWNDDVKHGLLLRVTFSPGGVRSVEEIPVFLGSDRRTCPSS